MRNFYRMALFLVVNLVFFLSACSKEQEKDKTAAEGGKSDDPVTVTRRQKIEKLTPKTFFKVSIALMEEQKRWSADFREYMNKKRKNFYSSFGITEKRYNDYSMNNHAELQKYLQRNPGLNRTMSRYRSMYTQ